MLTEKQTWLQETVGAHADVIVVGSGTRTVVR